MKEFVEILSPGLYTSIQDRGRVGFRKFGVPNSGAMDRLSAAMANTLLNNKLEAAVMEITLSGPKLLFHADSLIAITGANLSPQINTQYMRTGRVCKVNAGDIISFGKPKLGSRCYLAVKGGFQVDVILKSRSFYQAITGKDRFEKSDLIRIKKHKEKTNLSNASLKLDEVHFTTNKIECTKGPEFDLIGGKEIKGLFSQEFTISSDNSRMGYRLNSTAIQYPSDFSMLTSSVLPGTVQLTPSGQLIVLMQDCQTTGGYPRILQLSAQSINRLAQKKAGDKFLITSI